MASHPDCHYTTRTRVIGVGIYTGIGVLEAILLYTAYFSKAIVEVRDKRMQAIDPRQGKELGRVTEHASRL